MKKATIVFSKELIIKFLENHNDDPEYLKSQVSRVRNWNTDTDPEPYRAINPTRFDVLLGCRIEYGPDDNDKQKAFVTHVFDILKDRQRQGCYVIYSDRARKAKHQLHPLPVETAHGPKAIVPYPDSSPNKFSKPTAKALEAWMQWCDEARDKFIMETASNEATLREFYEKMKAAHPEIEVLSRSSGLVTSFRLVWHALEFTWTAEEGKYYRSAPQIHWEDIPSDDDFLNGDDEKTAEKKPDKSKYILHRYDKILLKSWGYSNDEMSQIEEAINRSTYSLDDGTEIDYKEAMRLLETTDFLSGISHSAFHLTSARPTKNGNEIIHFDSHVLFD